MNRLLPFIFSFCALTGCASTIVLVHPVTQERVTCSTRIQPTGGLELALRYADVETCAKQYEGLGFVRAENLTSNRPTEQQLEAVRAYKSMVPSQPFCYPGLWWDGTIVIYVSPGYESYGIKPGDKILSMDGKEYFPEKGRTAGSMFETWAREHKPGDRVHFVVDRNGSTVNANVVCGDGHALVKPWMAAVEDWASGRGSSCQLNLAEAQRNFGPHSELALLRIYCQRLREGSTGSTSWAVAEYLYDYARLLLQEKKISGQEIDSIRGSILTVIAALESEGYTRHAQDLEKQLDLVTAQPAPTTSSGKAAGTCFAVGPAGTVITAHHVVKGAKSIRVMLSDGTWGKAEVTEVSPSNDVAVLKLQGQPPGLLPIASPRSARIGQRVFTMGYPAVSILGTEAKFTEGTISALSGPGGERNFLQVTVPIQPGSSGSPLVNESGQVLGILTSTAATLPFVKATGSLPQNINWAINIDFARPLFDTHPASRSRTREEAIEVTRKALCLVEASL